MNFDTLADYCKFLEKNFSLDIAIPKLPLIVRLDGKCFKKFTESLKKDENGKKIAFNEGLNTLMVETAKHLAELTGAVIAYHQSDEITLILHTTDRKQGFYLGGKKQKLTSLLAAECTAFFNANLPKYLPNHNKTAYFDCRVYQTPDLHDAAMQLLWRENDATKNSISMLAETYFSPNVLKGLNGNQKQEKMMVEKGVNWNDLPAKFKRGTYIQKRVISTPFSVEELENLPPQHNARKNPNIVIERRVYQVVDMPIFNTIGNKVEVVFFGQEPIKTLSHNSGLQSYAIDNKETLAIQIGVGGIGTTNTSHVLGSNNDAKGNKIFTYKGVEFINNK